MKFKTDARKSIKMDSGSPKLKQVSDSTINKMIMDAKLRAGMDVSGEIFVEGDDVSLQNPSSVVA